MMGGCLGMKVPGSSQLKWLPKAARGGAGPGEPGSGIGSYGRRGAESTRAGVAEGTVGVAASSPLSREALGNARGGDGPGHVQRGRCRGVRGGKGRARGGLWTSENVQGPTSWRANHLRCSSWTPWPSVRQDRFVVRSTTCMRPRLRVDADEKIRGKVQTANQPSQPPPKLKDEADGQASPGP